MQIKVHMLRFPCSFRWRADAEMSRAYPGVTPKACLKRSA